MRKILIILCAMFVGTAYACDTNQIDVLGDGTQCETVKFSLTTTSLTLPDESEFRWYMSARGTFYVDCGTDGTLSGTGAVGKTITRTDTTEALYTCTYTSDGSKTIRFAGTATGYSTDTKAAIRFYTGIMSFTYTVGYIPNRLPTSVAAISGSLGSIFPTLGQQSNRQPKFRGTFMNAQIQNIPENLFSEVSGHIDYMFAYTFAGCTGLTSIPDNLFSGLSGAAYCMFMYTFFSCTGLTLIPENLFAGLRGAASSMFSDTFGNCIGLTSIPDGLFSGLSGGAEGMFDSTFATCSGLISIPNNLFAGATQSATVMFHKTFAYCSKLSGYITPSMFAGLITNGSPTAEDMWKETFNGTKLAKTCPSGTTQFTTGYEDYWAGRVACVDENLVCGAGEYLPQHWFQCEKCPENNYCTGGTYPYSETITSGATACPSGKYAPAGMWESAQCGRILHIGDQVVYLRATKKTSPALHIDIDNDGMADYFGNMTTLDVPMTNGTQRKLKLSYGGQTYSVYDDSVDLTEYEP